MATTNGLAAPRKARRHVETLRRRHDFLVQRVAAIGPDHSGYDDAERTALAWALPVLEAEADHLARLRDRLGDVAR